ncbi:metal-dependent hydrolase [Haloarcula pelagica]|uniref:metal-dependent hydrolase n=1 Tax=Haloarcula pelagica TaxID=3033389 RepID=UPI0024C287EC|nr:metal-dependent hydrolase [Halomicroarcula sp. YJ-61-S]
MFVGHGLFAFAVVVLLAQWLGVAPRRAVQFGAVAGLFAAVPDVDVVYAPVGLLLRSTATVGPDVFWETANVIHRGPTHSLVMGGTLAVAAVCWRLSTGAGRALAVALVVSLTVVAAVVSGPVGGVVTLVFAASGLAVAAVAGRLDVSPRTLLPLALVGLLSHPFGDLFTGSPPPLLYPFDVQVVTDLVVLHPDPTLHLLGAFAIELSTVWLAVYAYAHSRGQSLTRLVHPRASLGVGYAGAALVIPAPTLEQSAHFVFSVLALGAVGTPIRPFSREVDWLSTLVTGLAAVTIAALAYALALGAL